ncbi:MAG: cytochrome C [Rhizobiaceae bacterium]
MKRLLSLFVFALALAGAGAIAMIVWPLNSRLSKTSEIGDVNRGAYLARMSGCIACHTNTKNNGAPLAGGLAIKTGFGVFHSPNLTTDKEFGIGDWRWSIEQFALAVRKGISPPGEPYYPAFPYPFYSKLTGQDIADLWAAFQTVPPVQTVSKPQEMNFPFNFRSGLKLWRAAFLDQSSFASEPNKSELWNRGKYIVEGPAHCGARHTPRNFAGARQVEQQLHGASELPNGGKSPPITPEKLQIKGWTISNLKYALKTGVPPDGDAFGGAMGEVVQDGTSFLNDDDLTAIAT